MKKRTIHELDASNMAVGRLASKIALFLCGKNAPSFVPYRDDGGAVVVKNARQVKFTGRKLVQKDYYHHTMYPGGIKRTPMKKVFEQDPREVIRHAVYGMLPKNRQRDERMKRLTIHP